MSNLTNFPGASPQTPTGEGLTYPLVPRSSSNFKHFPVTPPPAVLLHPPKTQNLAESLIVPDHSYVFVNVLQDQPIGPLPPSNRVAKRTHLLQGGIRTGCGQTGFGREIGIISDFGLDWIGLSNVLRPRQQVIWEMVFTGQKTQPTVSKY